MKNNMFLKIMMGTLTGTAMISSCNEKLNSKKVKGPNILFIFTDQQTINDMGAYGNPYVRTPNMDNLARFGVRFTQSYCTSPVSAPSRSSFMTGHMPHETKVIYNDNCMQGSFLTMGELFQKAGYKTYYAGKWHLPEEYPAAKDRDSIPGFQLLKFKNKERISGYGKDSDPIVTSAVEDFFHKKPEQPFLLCVSLLNPHDICGVPYNIHNLDTVVNPDCLPALPANHPYDPDEPEFIKECRNRTHYGQEVSSTHNFSSKDWRQYLYHYYRYTEKVDAEIGRIIEALEYAGLEENTLIIFTSDHGDGASSHHWAVKLSFYEEPVKVPFIVTWFGKTPAGRVDSTHLISGLDVLPTMLGYAGLEIPTNIEGRNVKQIIDNPLASWRSYLVSELAPDPDKKDFIGRMIRTERFKYNIYSWGKHNEQFFDLKKDPGEMHNLANDSCMKNFIEQHRIILKQWSDSTSDYFKTK